MSGSRFFATNVTLRMMVGYAYGVRNPQIAGGPRWLDSEILISGRKPKASGLFR